MDRRYRLDRRNLPATSHDHLAARISIADPTCLKRYLDRPASHREHAGEILPVAALALDARLAQRRKANGAVPE